MNGEAKVLVALADHLRRTVADVEKLLDRRVVVSVESPDGSVSVAVDARGHLVRLRLAPGTTHRVPCEVLEAVINETLTAAARGVAAADLTQVS